jgi:hypothetical protein
LLGVSLIIGYIKSVDKNKTPSGKFRAPQLAQR